MDSNSEPADDGAAEIQGEHLSRAKGRALVRECLIGALAPLGPRRGQTVEAMHKEQAAVAERLSYMTETNLRALVEVALRMAGVMKEGPKQTPAWPDPPRLFAWAFGLQFPPPRDSDYITSMMRSRLGDRAMDGGWQVPLFRHLRRGPLSPVSGYVEGQLRAEADDNRRTLRRIAERIETGRSGPDDQRWLDTWHRDAAEAEALVIAGRTARAAKLADQGEVAA